MMTAVASAQKPPMQMPSKARPIISTVKFGAAATRISDNSMNAVIITRTHLRFSVPATVVTSRLAATANRPLIEIACPVWPSVARSPSAIGVSRLTGMNSEAISIAAQSAIERAAPQAAAGLASASSIMAMAAMFVCSCMNCCSANLVDWRSTDYPQKLE
jgi:hypothetical protein